MSTHIARHVLNPSSCNHRVDQRRGPLHTLVRAVIRNHRRRQMVRTLQALDDRLLRDIGIPRSDIYRVVSDADAHQHERRPAVATAPDMEQAPYQQAA